MTFHKKPATLPILLAFAASLSGCVSFGGKPPERLLSLDAARKVAPGTLRSTAAGTTITVADPESPKLLDTVRVPVRTSPTSLAYVTKVQWADTPRHLFQKLLQLNNRVDIIGCRIEADDHIAATVGQSFEDREQDFLLVVSRTVRLDSGAEVPRASDRDALPFKWIEQRSSDA